MATSEESEPGTEQDIDKTGIDRQGQGNKENEAGFRTEGENSGHRRRPLLLKENTQELESVLG